MGHFTKTLDMPAPIVWTNQTNITAVNRGQGVTVTWSGGAPGTFVTITGSSAATVSGRNITTAFTCQAPVSALSFTVPSYVLLGMVASSSGSLSVGNSGNVQTFTVSGLDLGAATATATTSKSLPYN